MKRCSRCGKKTTLTPCNRCLKGMAATREWVKKFMRHRAAIKAARTRRLRSMKKVLRIQE